MAWPVIRDTKLKFNNFTEIRLTILKNLLSFFLKKQIFSKFIDNKNFQLKE